MSGSIDSASSQETLADAPDPRGDEAGALEREHALAAVRRGLLGDDGPTMRIGRFEIRRRLGAGAMGSVFEGYDESLDRGVAVKLLHADDGTAGRARGRLLREAQTLAKLRHPNVVSVHEVGEHDGRVYIAMELVDGVDLRDWLSSERRSWQVIVGCFAKAGNGLAAAHDAGLVHRDFKPDNVLVARDGNVLVADFGLARSVEDDPVALETTTTAERLPEGVEARLTHTGALLGTPAYMAPELFGGRPATPASDQFAFCVSLFEALHGTRPFQGRTIVSLAASILAGEVSGSGRNAEVPAWLDRVIVRGLQTDPKLRWPTMVALISALRRDRERRRRRIGIGAAALAGMIGVGFAWGHTNNPALCSGLHDELDDIWNDGSRQAVVRAFQSSGHPEAERMLTLVTERLDGFTKAWVGQRLDACIATSVRAEQSATMLDRRLACLDRAQADLRATVEVLRDATPEVVTRADAVVPRPEVLDDCSTSSVLAGGIAMPARTDIRKAIADVEQNIARSRAARDAGRGPESIALAEQALQEARRLGYAPTVARASFALGAAYSLKSETLEAVGPLDDAIVAAEEGQADLTRFWATALLARRQADLDRVDEARGTARRAEALLHRIGSAPDREIDLAVTWGDIEGHAGKFDAAEKSYARAVEVARQDDDTMSEAHALQAQASVALERSETERAKKLYEEALSLYRAVHGDKHPATAAVLTSLGTTYARNGAYDEAEAAFRESLEIRREFVPDDDPSLSNLYLNLGVIAYHRGDVEAALQSYERALTAKERDVGKDSAEIARILTNIGYAQSRLGDTETALQTMQRALKRRREALGEDHTQTGDAWYNVAFMLRRLERYDEALEHYQRSRDIHEQIYGVGHSQTLPTLEGVAFCLTQLGRPRQAETMARKALAAPAVANADARVVAGLEFALAIAVDARGGSQERAVELARAALARVREAGGDEDRESLIEGWLAERSP